MVWGKSVRVTVHTFYGLENHFLRKKPQIVLTNMQNDVIWASSLRFPAAMQEVVEFGAGKPRFPIQ